MDDYELMYELMSDQFDFAMENLSVNSTELLKKSLIALSKPSKAVPYLKSLPKAAIINLDPRNVIDIKRGVTKYISASREDWIDYYMKLLKWALEADLIQQQGEKIYDTINKVRKKNHYPPFVMNSFGFGAEVNGDDLIYRCTDGTIAYKIDGLLIYNLVRKPLKQALPTEKVLMTMYVIPYGEKTVKLIDEDKLTKMASQIKFERHKKYFPYYDAKLIYNPKNGCLELIMSPNPSEWGKWSPYPKVNK